MSLSEDDIAAAAEHALGLDEGVARDEARRRQATDPEFRAEVAAWEEDLADLWDGTDEVAPPRRVRRRLMHGLAGRRARPWAAALSGLLAGAAAAVLAVLVLLPALDPAPPTPSVVAEIATEGDGLRVLAAYDAEEGAFRVRRLAGTPPPGRDFELWAIPPGGAPVSLGVLGEEGVAPLPDALLAVLNELTLAISEEETGGSTTGVPETVLATAPVTTL
ncbi:MAG: anti-sigma factor [Pseudomonadota bacterium]